MSGNTASSNRRECLTSSTQQLHKLIAVLLPRGKEGEKAVTEVQSLSAFFFFSNSLQNIKVSLLFCTLALPLLARTPSCRESTSVSVFRGFLWFTAAAFVFRGGWVAFGFVFLCFPPLYIYIYFPFTLCFTFWEFPGLSYKCLLRLSVLSVSSNNYHRPNPVQDLKLKKKCLEIQRPSLSHTRIATVIPCQLFSVGN